ncbi:DUF1223 domain-containing protein [Aquamicrobium segne]|uniref:DUF1223 domain-containing protein n=1 Tax=Aquamicrobium segne TaxID=469547 RepID=A0ABW0GZ28_9HYPH
MPTIRLLRSCFVAHVLSLLLCVPVSAQESDGVVSTPVGVVELFTSQGCNACPPADRFFTELAARGDVIALAYHVDYWNYLGWRDTLSNKDNTKRQYAYMRAFEARSVYTPQAVINGRTHVNGADRAAVDFALSTLKSAGNGMKVPVTIRREGESMVIEAGDTDLGGGLPASARVVLAWFEPPQTVDIVRGRNHDRQVTYWNAVSAMQTVGVWHGKSQRYELPVGEMMQKGGCAVLLQGNAGNGLPGPIIGAAMIRDGML